MEADADADADATAPAGLGLPPRPISPPRLDSDAPPHGAHGEAEGGGIGQDAVHRQVGFYLGGAGRQVLGDDRDGDVQRAGVDAALGEADSSRISQDDVPALPVAQRQVGFYLGDAVDRQVLGNGQDGEVPDAARFAAVPPGGDPAGDDVDLQVLPEQHAVGLDHDGADHVGERIAEDPQGIEAGGDGITPDALPLVGHGAMVSELPIRSLAPVELLFLPEAVDVVGSIVVPLFLLEAVAAAVTLVRMWWIYMGQAPIGQMPRAGPFHD